MASDSSRLRTKDLRSIYLLVGECCELGADPYLWRGHMLSRLNELLGAISSVVIEATLDASLPGAGAHVDSAVSLDQFSPSERAILTECMRKMPVEGNPLGLILLDRSSREGPIASVRRELISDSQWDRSRIVDDYFRPIGWYDMLSAIVPRRSGFQCLNFSREVGDANFPKRAGSVLAAFIRELGLISEPRLASMSGESLLALPLRERQVLLALAEGDDEKQVSLRLGISRSTVHEYVRRLLKRYCVSSRGQLLICAARQIHALNLRLISAPEKIWYFQPNGSGK